MAPTRCGRVGPESRTRPAAGLDTGGPVRTRPTRSVKMHSRQVGRVEKGCRGVMPRTTRQAMHGLGLAEGDGWVNWSGLATLLADVGRLVSDRLERLVG